jgi:hypothetical protein
MTSFGGIGVEIMTFKTTFEKEIAQVNLLIERIDQQTAVVATLHDEFSRFYLHKIVEGYGELKKLSDATALQKNLVTCKGMITNVCAEMEKLRSLQSECRKAQERAEAALPDFAMHSTDGRLDVVPNHNVFTAEKGGKIVKLDTPQQPQSQPMATIADAALSQRFFRE